MLTHERIWAAIDALAERNHMSVSGLARRAGLDPTTFNPSKRLSRDGRERWPSTESIAKILDATGEEVDNFMDLIAASADRMSPEATVPLLGFAQAGEGGYFDDGGFPAGSGWDEISFPGPASETAYALEVQGDSMQPLYRDGDIVIVDPSQAVRRGDRVVVRTGDGEVMAKVLKRQTATAVELVSLNPDHADRIVPLKQLDWIARIVWASQ